MSNLQRYPSPDGRYSIVVVANEVRMSHWILSPALWHTETDCCVLLIGSELWSADRVEWEGDSRAVVLEMRRYPGDGPGLQVTIFPELETAELRSERGVATTPFSKLSERMDTHGRGRLPG